MGRRDIAPGRVLIIDDEPASLIRVASCLQTGRYEVAACNRRLEAVKQLVAFRPDLIIADFRMADMDGPQLVRRLRYMPHTESPALIFLLEKENKTDRIDAYRIGADAVVIKPFDPDELLATVAGILNRVHDAHADVEQMESLPARTPAPQQVVQLTCAERRVAIALARGLTNKEIAKQLGVSVRTVENHISHILLKKGFANRVEIARYVYETRLQA